MTMQERELAEGILRPGHNVWRIARAPRAAVLIDAANYFGALRAAMLSAERSIHIVGWDVDSRTNLVGETCSADDGFPLLLGDFLDALVAAKPWLSIRILLWDYSVFFATEREALPTLALRWKRPPQIDLCLDDTVPSGSSHHQKIVVIDDALAFAGGLDLTIRRWDDCCHDCTHPHRVDPAGKPYAPFHDVQMLVDGEAAHALADLTRDRWETATGEALERLEGTAAPWPSCVTPHFRDVEIGIARTMPPLELSLAEGDSVPPAKGIREVEQLFIDMVDQATESIYIESQYLTYAPLAEAIAARLRQQPRLQAVLVTPRSYHGHFERQAMLSGRARFIAALEAANAQDRWIVISPRAIRGNDPAAAEESVDISVHSKVMIVDDRYLRVGSANVSNRSMRPDSECDLVVVAGNAANSAAVAHIRHRLLAEHAGLEESNLGALTAEHGSLVAALRARCADDGKIVEIDGETDAAESSLPLVQALADPVEPLARRFPPAKHYMHAAAAWLNAHSTLVFCTVLVIGLTCLSAAWAWSPLTEEAGINDVKSWISTRGSHWNLLAVIFVFVLAGFVAFPVVALIIATTALYGAWPGIGYAAAGAMCSAMATYLLGRWVGHPLLRRFLGPRLNRVTQGFVERGILAVTVIRLLPVAPYTMVNLVAGAMRVSPLDYALGTFLGLLPGFAVMGLVGQQVVEVIRNPTPLGITLLVGLLLLAIAVSFLLQLGITALRKKPRDALE